MRLLYTISALVGLVSGQAQQLQRVTAFNSGPTAAQMWVYRPANPQAKPPILLAIHYCTGTAQAYFQNSPYAKYADTYGFIVIYPSSPNSGTCWDVASTQTLTHNGGGDSKTIINMVAYAVANYGADPDRVYATGSSSGAMMTNVLAGAYPDVIKAGSAYSGVPDGCFYVQGASPPPSGQAPGWNSQCSGGTLIKTAQQWGDQARGYYPGYTGPRPKMALWHGTVDTTLYYNNLAEALKQWSNVLGVSFTRNLTNNPDPNYTRMEYGDGTKLLGFSAQGVGHTVPIHGDFDLAWFGLNSRTSPTSSSTTQSVAVTTSSTTRVSTSVTTTLITTTPATTPATTPSTTSQTTSAGGATSPHWGQCGGQGWTGPTACADGTTCQYSNPWYSQCL